MALATGHTGWRRRCHSVSTIESTVGNVGNVSDVGDVVDRRDEGGTIFDSCLSVTSLSKFHI